MHMKTNVFNLAPIKWYFFVYESYKNEHRLTNDNNDKGTTNFPA